MGAPVILRLRRRHLERPLLTPFATALGRKSRLHSVLVSVELEGGAGGLGEVPTSFAFPAETPAAIDGLLARAAGALPGLPLEAAGQALARLRAEAPSLRMTLAGLEVALFRARLASGGEDELAAWGGASRELETDLTIPFAPGDPAVAAWTLRGIRAGFTCFKIKIGGDPETDLAFLGAVQAQLEARLERFQLRLDGNQSYDGRRLRVLLRGLERSRAPVELLEQPLPRGERRGLRRLRGRLPFPVILDESVLDPDEGRRAIDEELADGINIKIAKSGIAGARELVALARQAGLRLMIGCMTETMVGLSAGIALAAGTGAFHYVDLDGVHFLRHRRQEGPVLIEGPRYRWSG